MIMWFYPPVYAGFLLIIQQHIRAMCIHGYNQAFAPQTFHNNV